MTKKITLVGWHIGNLDTVGKAAFDALDQAEVILFEMDSAKPASQPWPEGYFPGDALVRNADKIKSYHYYEKTGFSEILNNYSNVVVMAAAGMPGIQDPGATIIRAIEGMDDWTVDVIPGPDTITSMIAISGFTDTQFAFGGIIRIGDPDAIQTKSLSKMAETGLATVFFIRDAVVKESLEDLASAFGINRNVVVAANISRPTMMIERGTLGQIINNTIFLDKINGSSGQRSRIAIALEGL